MVAVRLYDHNKKAYSAAIAMLQSQGKAAVIHPTGTGKSFIGFKLCEDNPDRTICWVSPSGYIFNTQMENLKAESDGYQPKNIRFFTYARLMNMTPEEVEEIRPDYIVLDEFHRCGARQWGKGVEALISMYDHVPLLGLSATAVRYLDNQRDMSLEIFDGHVASRMTLGEAIVRGILNPPKYVRSIFSYQKELGKYEARAAALSNDRLRHRAEEYLEQLRRALARAEGLDEIFDRHMKDRNGRYLVFCTNYEAMKEAMDKAHEWFHLVDPDPHIYSVYSDDPTSEEAFRQFKEDHDGRHLKLLFCIDALNEGVHVENVSGVILLRPTVSPIVYKQQIGRALSASKSTEPVVFDIVNNIEGLYSIDAVREEMDTAVDYIREGLEDGHVVNETFKVIDEVSNCLELFNDLEKTLTANWDLMYLEAKSYFMEQGDLNVPSSYFTETGYHLGRWIVIQRANRKKGDPALTEEKIRALDEIGMSWVPADERIWNQYYQAACIYYERQCQEDRSNADGYHERQCNTEDCQEGQQDKSVKKKHRPLDIPVHYVTEDGLKLGSWYRSVRNRYIRGSLTPDRQEAMEAIGASWESVRKNRWTASYQEAKNYYKDHGDLNVPHTYMAGGIKLGIWISSQREAYARGSLPYEQIRLLNKIGMSWDRHQERWEEAFRLCLTYIEEGGDINQVPKDYIYRGFPIYNWLKSQKAARKAGRLSTERQERLESIGFSWSASEAFWNKGYRHACNYMKENGNLKVPKGYICEDGFKLKSWVNNQRTRVKKGTLSEGQKDKLSAIGIA